MFFSCLYIHIRFNSIKFNYCLISDYRSLNMIVISLTMKCLYQGFMLQKARTMILLCIYCTYLQRWLTIYNWEKVLFCPCSSAPFCSPLAFPFASICSPFASPFTSTGGNVSLHCKKRAQHLEVSNSLSALT